MTEYQKRRAKRWADVSWANLRPGDTVTFIDHDGRFSSALVDRWSAGEIITMPQTYKGYVVFPAVTISQHSLSQLRGRRKGAASFLWGERLRFNPFKRRT